MSNQALLALERRSGLLLALQAQGWPTPPPPKPAELPQVEHRACARGRLSDEDMFDDGYVWYRGSWWKRSKARERGFKG